MMVGTHLVAELRAAMHQLEHDIGHARRALCNLDGIVAHDRVDTDVITWARGIAQFARVSAREAMLRAFRGNQDA